MLFETNTFAYGRGTETKKRPALVLNNEDRQEIIISAITSNTRRILYSDTRIEGPANLPINAIDGIINWREGKMAKPWTRKNAGVAMIVVLVMIIIFASLILAVTISSSAAIRRAHSYKDKAIALEIAEAGIQDALYWMNYKGYDSQNYPASNSDILYFRGTDYTKSDTWTDDPETFFNPTNNIPQGQCQVKIQGTEAPNSHTLFATGSYRGRTATVSVALKGTNTADKLNAGNQGIAEAFNKKAIYAKTVVPGDVNWTGINIKGNITTSTTKPSTLPGNQATWTESEITPDVISDIVRFDTENCHFDVPSVSSFLPADPGSPYDDRYDNSGNLINATYPAPGTPVNGLDNGVFWDGAGYLFGKKDLLNPEDFDSAGKSILVEADATVPDNAGSVTINSYFKSTGNISINKSITTAASGAVFHVQAGKSFSLGAGLTVTGTLAVRSEDISFTLILDGNTITERVICANNITTQNTTAITHDMVSGGNIDITGPTTIEDGNIVANKDITIGAATTITKGDMVSQGSITIGADTTVNAGDVLSKKDITVKADLTVNGCIVSSKSTPSTPSTPQDHTISFTGGNITINATDSEYDAAILVHPFNDGTTNGTVDISRPVTITLGEHQKTAILVCAVNGIINLNSAPTITYAKNPPDQFAIVNFSGEAGSAVNINTDLDLKGSIYSYRKITLNDNTQHITGILIAGEELTIGNNSYIVYEGGSYHLNPEVYKGFTGGRRRYVPVPGSWQVKW